MTCSTLLHHADKIIVRSWRCPKHVGLVQISYKLYKPFFFHALFLNFLLRLLAIADYVPLLLRLPTIPAGGYSSIRVIIAFTSLSLSALWSLHVLWSCFSLFCLPLLAYFSTWKMVALLDRMTHRRWDSLQIGYYRYEE